MDLQAWTLCGFLLSRTTIWATFGAFWDIFEGGRVENVAKNAQKRPKFVFKAKIIPLNAISGRFWIYHMKIWGLSFNLSYRNPATWRVQRDYFSFKNKIWSFWGILGDFGKINFFSIFGVKITLKMVKKSKFSKKTLCSYAAILTTKIAILNFFMPKN